MHLSPEHKGVGGGACSGRFLHRYSNKNRNFGRLFALLTEKSLNVCSRRVESVWIGEGGRFGRGCGAAQSKTKWHRSDPHIVLDKDAAQRAAGALAIKLELRGESRRRSDLQVFSAPLRTPRPRHHAVTVLCALSAGGSLRRRPDRG